MKTSFSDKEEWITIGNNVKRNSIERKRNDNKSDVLGRHSHVFSRCSALTKKKAHVWLVGRASRINSEWKRIRTVSLSLSRATLPRQWALFVMTVYEMLNVVQVDYQLCLCYCWSARYCHFPFSFPLLLENRRREKRLVRWRSTTTANHSSPRRKLPDANHIHQTTKQHIITANMHSIQVSDSIHSNMLNEIGEGMDMDQGCKEIWSTATDEEGGN